VYVCLCVRKQAVTELLWPRTRIYNTFVQYVIILYVYCIFFGTIRCTCRVIFLVLRPARFSDLIFGALVRHTIAHKTYVYTLHTCARTYLYPVGRSGAKVRFEGNTNTAVREGFACAPSRRITMAETAVEAA